MIALPLWLRLTLWAAVLAGGAWLGWTVESWREGAARASSLSAALRDERSLRAASEGARVKLSAELARASATVHTQIKEVIRRVPRLIPDSRGCDLNDELVGALNRARGYGKAGDSQASR